MKLTVTPQTSGHGGMPSRSRLSGTIGAQASNEHMHAAATLKRCSDSVVGRALQSATVVFSYYKSSHQVIRSPWLRS